MQCKEVISQRKESGIRLTIGKVKWFDDNRGFGFIERPTKDDDVFFHISGACDEYRGRISSDDVVSFGIKQTRKGPNAVDVKLVRDGEYDIAELMSLESPAYWIPVFKTYLNSLPPAEMSLEAETRLNRATGAVRSTLAEQLPAELLLQHAKLREQLTPESRIRYCSELPCETAIKEIGAILWETDRPTGALARIVPKHFQILSPKIRVCLDPTEHMKLCLEMLVAEDEVGRKRIRNEMLGIPKRASWQADAVWRMVPPEFYETEPEVRKELPEDLHIQLLCKFLHNETLQPDLRSLFLRELAERIKSIFSHSIWNSVPVDIIKEQMIWQVVPAAKRQQILLADLEAGSISLQQCADGIVLCFRDNPSLAQKAGNWALGQPLEGWYLPDEDEYELPDEDAVERGRNADERSIPANLLAHPSVFAALPPEVQLDLKWDDLSFGSQQAWDALDDKARVYAVMRDCKEGSQSLQKFISETKASHGLLYCISPLYHAITRQEPSRQSCDETSKRLFHYIEQNLSALPVDTEINLNPLLPRCPRGRVTHCEARYWKRFDGAAAFCPRTRGTCTFLNPDPKRQKENFISFGGRGARMTAVQDLGWKDWSLHELFALVDNTPLADGLAAKETYVNKLGGSLNRLNEIRLRLRCRKEGCGRYLRADWEYAKHFARFSATVHACPDNGPGHDGKTYINVCWACQEIIDSRDSIQSKKSHYYRCLECGSGEKFVYDQGSECPKCGGRMQSLGDREFECRNDTCNHRIKAPFNKTSEYCSEY